MDTKRILLLVAKQAPSLKLLRVDNLGGGLYAFHCQRDGLSRCVQFTPKGLYGTDLTWSYDRSDETLAALIAEELTK